jgi:hypothetical protein
VAVGLTEDVTVDFELELGSVLSGDVRDGGDDLPLPGLTVRIYTAAGDQTGTPLVSFVGDYWASGLPPGQYYLQTQRNRLPVVNEVYDDLTCLGEECDATAGTLVDLPAGAIVRDIDFELNHTLPCASEGTDLCVQNDRFRAEVRWQNGSDSDRATVFPITDDTGAFWFFGPGNLEVVIKVIDGCSLNNRYWVFTSGLTNVGVEVTVTDTWSGEVWTHASAQGTTYDLVTDTSAFATCPF